MERPLILAVLAACSACATALPPAPRRDAAPEIREVVFEEFERPEDLGPEGSEIRRTLLAARAVIAAPYDEATNLATRVTLIQCVKDEQRAECWRLLAETYARKGMTKTREDIENYFFAYQGYLELRPEAAPRILRDHPEP